MYPEAIAFLNLIFLVEIEIGKRVRSNWMAVLAVGVIALLLLAGIAGIFLLPICAEQGATTQTRAMWLQALVMVVLVIITLSYARDTRRMAEETKKMAEAAEQSAKVTAQMAEATKDMLTEAREEVKVLKQQFEEERWARVAGILGGGPTSVFNEIQGNTKVRPQDEERFPEERGFSISMFWQDQAKLLGLPSDLYRMVVATYRDAAKHNEACQKLKEEHDSEKRKAGRETLAEEEERIRSSFLRLLEVLLAKGAD
ncbi:MAG: hypothetical protein GXP25_12035 [Planctomycetes bacterium]|nr:hypothetical protein [Planctomycetota bacterium]